ncbi:MULTISPECIES: NAD(+) kinase [unclassified Campylobacter]|uniref:NAD(+) kinase n=1 Tax=unclassified Campylobacter TaxID=2593542 RepID=UPI003D341152
MKNLDIKNIKKVGIVAKIDNDLGKNLSILKEIFKKFNVCILLENLTAKAIGQDGFRFEKLARECELLISLGGDGTLISVARKSAKISPFIVSIHTGHLGFLTTVTINECEIFFKEFFEAKFEISRPFMLDVFMHKKNGETVHKVAFNDAVIMREKPVSIAKVEAFLNGKYFNTYFGDGIIASTPVGSTAYNMSAGGAIIYPLSDVFSLTPICSHSLTQRPIILSKNLTVELRASNDEVLVIDGQDSFSMSEFSGVSVGLSKIYTNLVRKQDEDYFQILKQKLHWGYND